MFLIYIIETENSMKNKKLVCGVGVNDLTYIGNEDAYKTEKEKWIKVQADYYYSIGQIGKDIHTALQNWVV